MIDSELNPPDPENSKWVGKVCTVILDRTPKGKVKAKITGKMFRADIWGEVQIQDGYGDIRYCWPALEIREPTLWEKIVYNLGL